MATLTKADIVEIVLNKVDGLEREDAKGIIEEIFEEVRSALENGEHVRLSGFGNFILRDKETRPGRNPKTGEEVDIVARRVVTFKAGKKLRDRVENSMPKSL